MKVRDKADTSGFRYEVLEESARYYIVEGEERGVEHALLKAEYEPVPEWVQVKTLVSCLSERPSSDGMPGDTITFGVFGHEFKDYRIRLIKDLRMGVGDQWPRKTLLLERRS